MPKHHYIVEIPYWHRFLVVAEGEAEAIDAAHEETGTIRGYIDAMAVVEMVDDELGAPEEE